MKLEFGRTYVDNTSAYVRIICIDKAKEPHSTCVGLRMMSNGFETVEEYHADGMYANPEDSLFYDDAFSLRLVAEVL